MFHLICGNYDFKDNLNTISGDNRITVAVYKCVRIVWVRHTHIHTNIVQNTQNILWHIIIKYYLGNQFSEIITNEN